MGKLNLRSAGRFQRNANTKSEYDRDNTVEGVTDVLNKISRSPTFGRGKVCYIVGMGGQPRSTYTSLKQTNGLQVLFFRSVLPRYVKFLSPFIASYEGVVKVEDIVMLPKAFLQLMNRSMVGVYCFSDSYEGVFVANSSRNERIRSYDFGIKVDPEYSFYIVDADNSESKTGIVEIVSYGINTPADLIPIPAT